MRPLRTIALLLLLIMTMSACGPRNEASATNTPPTEEATVQIVDEPTPEPVLDATATAVEEQSEQEPTAEPMPAESTANSEDVGTSTTVEFWTADIQGERLAAYRNVADRYMAENPGVEVVIVPVEESTISMRLREAAMGKVLPDIARIGLEQLAPLLAAGLLDQSAADSTVDAIGRDDFRDGPLAMVTDAESGLASAVPFDGWIQALWYRRDLFEGNQLESPITWEQINVACDVFGHNEGLPYGITLPTDPQQNYVHQVFEQVAMSNNAWPFDDAGNVTMNTPEMISALRFYTNLQRCAPTGIQDLYDARENYETEQQPMLIYSTYIMDDLIDGSDLRDSSGKVELTKPDLAENTAFSSGLVGPNGVASYGQLTALAILDGADPIAQDVVRYFMTEGYRDIISTAPLGKIPVLESAAIEWTTLSPVFEHYSPATLGHIASGFDNMQRWLFRPDYSNREKAIIGEIEGELIIPQVIYNIVVEKSMTPETGAEWLQQQVEQLAAQR